MDYEFGDKNTPSSSRAVSMGSELFRENNGPSTHYREAPGMWGRLMMSIRGFWQTRDTDDTLEDRELHIKTTLRELVVYVLFLLVLMILAFGMANGKNYYFTNTMSSIFSLEDVTTLSDYWNYLLNTLPGGLYWTTRYDGMNVPVTEMNYIAYENKLLGVPRIRQVKVRPDSCVIAPSFKNDITACYAPYTDSAEDREAFGLMNDTAWQYTDGSQLGNQRIEGQLATYPAGGFYQDLKTTSDETNATLTFLFQNYWVTRGSRAAIVDFTVYNPNVNLFCVVKLIAEFPPSGNVLTSTDFRTVKLLRYVTPMDYFVLACECIFLVFIIYYSIEETIEIKKHKLVYFTSFWNILDVVVVLVSYLCAGFNVYRTITVNSKLEALLKDETKYQDFDFISFWQLQFDRAVALLVFVAWVKLFKYISFNKTMNQLSYTLEKCAKDLAGFFFMFSIVFCAFAQLGNLLFGTVLDPYKDFTTTLFTLFRIILGDFDFDGLVQAHRLLGPLYFIIYIFFVFFVLINMFLAIINDTYSEVKEELANKEDEYAIGSFFKERANILMDKLHLKREKIVDIQDALNVGDADGDQKINFEEWRIQLKRRGYADAEIEAVFSKYDTDGDRVLDSGEQNKMQKELEDQKASVSQEIADTEAAVDAVVNVEQVYELTTKINDMEVYIGEMTEKMNSLLGKLDSLIEKRKKGRKEGKSMEHLNVTSLQSGFEVLDSWNSTTDSMSVSSSRISLGKKKGDMEAKQL